MIGSEKGGVFTYERKAGGAPFNVACAAKRFGAESAFAGCVGDDAIGRFLERFADGRVDRSYIVRSAEWNTTLAFVELDQNGERSFSFYRKHTADYRLPEIPEDLFAAANIVHIGSLMLSERCGEEYAENLARRARNAGKLVSFDVNFRSDIFRNREEAVQKYRNMLSLADVVKFSEDETEIFTRKYLEEELSDRLVCVSLGGSGSEWRYRGRSGKVPSVSVKPVDTTGAGDAFYAGVLTGLDNPQAQWTDEFLNETFRFANVCGALNTLGRGAIDCLPDRDEVEAVLKAL